MSPAQKQIYAARRAQVIDAIRSVGPGGIAVIASAPVFIRNNDVEHDYRQDSDVFYLTGFDEPDSVVVLLADEAKFVLFVRPRDPEREVWDGARAGVEGAVSEVGATEAFKIADLATELPKLLSNQSRLYYRLGRDRVFDERMLSALEASRRRGRMGVTFPNTIVDPGAIVHELRMFKQDAELDAMRRAAAITREAHERAMRAAKPGMYEHEIEAILLETFRRGGSERVAYGSIVGSGPNATVLHYRSNNRKMESGDLLLIDAGCEYGYYASDVTRTFPVSGSFTKEQQAIYEVVLQAQLESIALTRAGVTLDEIHNKSVEVITRGLIGLGVLVGELATLIEKQAFKPFYMHRTSHFIGMDVHDVGAYYVAGKHRPLAPGMVITVEPGIYISRDNQTVAPQWRGIGVRIEDDIVVTEGEPINLTEAIPKSVDELLRACA